MRKNPLTMKARIELPESKAERDIDKFIDRLVAKMEGRLHAKEDTYTLAYYLIRKIRMGLKWVGDDAEEYVHEISYEGAEALSYELRTHPGRPRKQGVLMQLQAELDRGIREKRQYDRDRKRRTKRATRPTVRESRGL